MLFDSTLGRQTYVRVLEADPELAGGLDDEVVRRIRKVLLGRAISLGPGPWDPGREARQPPGSLGLLVIDGLLAQRFTLAGGSALELLGPGDIVQPWDLDVDADDVDVDADGPGAGTGAGADTGGADAPAGLERSWIVIRPTELASLDNEFAAAAARWPEITVQLFRRATQRTSSLACYLAISHEVGVEQRIRHLLAYLSERWGRVTPDGVLLPVPLTNEMIGCMVGARPPSISTALRKLALSGEVARYSDGSWVVRLG